MNTDQSRNRIAQPADEALKKHGDQLQKPVDEAAGKPMQNEDGGQKEEPDLDD